MTAKTLLRAARSGLIWLAVWALWPAAPALAETVYISDELTVPVRTGPSPTHRILRIIRAGTPLEVLERDAEAGFTRVSLRDGAEGWVPDQYLVATPIARDRLEAATQEVARLRNSVAQLQAQLGALREQRGEAQESTETLSEEVLELESQLTEIRRLSANAIETENANRELQALNARLRSELDDLLQERDRLVEQAEQRWFMIGGALVLIGLLLGVLLKSRPRRSAWS